MQQLAARGGPCLLQAAHKQPPSHNTTGPGQRTMAVLRTSSPATTAARPSVETARSWRKGAQRSSAACSKQAARMATQ